MAPPPDDDDRESILARRARFVAAALAGLSATAGCDDCSPFQPCLSPAVREQPADPRPTPCLSPPPQVEDPVEPPPMPCLSPLPPPEPPEAPSGAPSGAGSTGMEPETRPRVCLRYAAPEDEEG